MIYCWIMVVGLKKKSNTVNYQNNMQVSLRPLNNKNRGRGGGLVILPYVGWVKEFSAWSNALSAGSMFWPVSPQPVVFKVNFKFQPRTNWVSFVCDICLLELFFAT